MPTERCRAAHCRMGGPNAPHPNALEKTKRKRKLEERVLGLLRPVDPERHRPVLSEGRQTMGQVVTELTSWEDYK